MKIPILITLFISISIFSWFSLQAEAKISLSKKSDYYPLDNFLKILEDKDQKFTIQEIKSSAFQQKFHSISSKKLNIGYTTSTIWIIFQIDSSNISFNDKKEWFIQFANYNIDMVSVYLPDQFGRYKKTSAGYTIPFSNWPIEHYSICFPIDLKAIQSQYIYMSVNSSDAITLDLALTSLNQLLTDSQQRYILYGIFYGSMLIMFVYSCFLYFSLRDLNYIYYCIYLCAVTLLLADMNGLAVQYLWQNSTWWATHCRAFLMMFMLITTGLFIKNFLEIKKWNKKLNLTLSIFLIVILCTGLISLFIPTIISFPLIMILSFIGAFSFLTIGYIRWIKGFRIARFYCAAWTMLLTGAMLYALNDFGIVPVSFISFNGYQIGTLLEVILLSLALGDRINTLKNEKENAQLSALNSMQEADRLKDQFLATTSHELRTPLHGIIGLSESIIFNNELLTDDTVKLNLSLIASSGRRLATLVNDIQDFQKSKHNELDLNLKPINIYIIVNTVIDLIKPLLNANVVINNNINDSIIIWADENRLTQIINNLLGNAIKFTSSGSIELNAKADTIEDKNMVIISVKDTGIGIPPGYQKRIFNSYEQVDGSISRAYGGTGIGLAITKTLVELHGGTIFLESTPGIGSKFSFSLLLYNDNFINISEIGSDFHLKQITTVTGSSESDEKIYFNPNILVVDDDPINVKILNDLFTNQPCSITTSSNGIEALDLISKQSYDLVLLDVMMPQLSGYEVCRRIRKTFNKKELPIIMLTAKITNKDIDDGYISGANDYIIKPCNLRELVNRINIILKTTRNTDTENNSIYLRDKTNEYSLKSSEILYLTSDGKRSVIHTITHDIQVSIQLKKIETLLPKSFMRIHKQYIVNIDHITHLSHINSGRYSVYLDDEDDTRIIASPGYYKSLQAILKNN